MLIGNPLGLDVAVLGWGSLLWDPGVLRIATAWQLTGFTLPLEFSRVSRGGRLTLVIDPDDGRECPVYYALSSFRVLEDARANLVEREKTQERPDNIAVVAAGDPQSSDSYRERIHTWTRKRGLRATIWSAFSPNFARKSDLVPGSATKFTVTNARRYLAKLRTSSPTGFADARDYIENAPVLVQTPLRIDLEEHGWP